MLMVRTNTKMAIIAVVAEQGHKTLLAIGLEVRH
jgi:hypothetical protein